MARSGAAVAVLVVAVVGGWWWAGRPEEAPVPPPVVSVRERTRAAAGPPWSELVDLSLEAEVVSVVRDRLETPAEALRRTIDEARTRLGGRPFVIANGSAVSDWPAMRAWSWGQLADRDAELKGVYINEDSRTFLYYREQRPLRAVLDASGQGWVPPFAARDLSLAEFCALVAEGKHVYFSGELSTLGPDFERQVADTDALAIGAKKSVNIWLGAAGVVAHAHFDKQENLFVQVSGRKRFVLWPPEAHRSLALFPRLHPSTRQSQVDLDAVDETRFPRFRGLAAYDIVLEPGQVLYLPPFYFHRVEALDNSISVNVWTAWLQQQSVSGRIKQLGTPMDPAWSPAKRCVALEHLVRMTITRTLGPDPAAPSPDPATVCAFLNTTLRPRYDGLFALDAPGRLCQPVGWFDPAGDGVPISFRDAASIVPALLRTVPAVAERELLLADYVEDSMESVLPPSDYAPFVYGLCG